MDSPPDTARLPMAFRLLTFTCLLVTGFGLLLAVDFDPRRALELIRGTSPIVFVGWMSILPLLGFPISALYLYAGSAYSWPLAWGLCSLSLAINIAVAYPIAKTLLAAPVSRFLAKVQKPLPELTEQNQFRVTFLARSIPGIPYFMQNYMLALLGIRFRTYFLVSWSVQVVFAAGMAAVPHLVEEAGWVPVGIIAAILLLLLVFKRIHASGKVRKVKEIPMITEAEPHPRKSR